MKEWQQVHGADVLHLQTWQQKLRLQSAFETCRLFCYDAVKEKVSAQLPTATFLWFLHGAAKKINGTCFLFLCTTLPVVVKHLRSINTLMADSELPKADSDLGLFLHTWHTAAGTRDDTISPSIKLDVLRKSHVVNWSSKYLLDLSESSQKFLINSRKKSLLKI